MIFIHSVAIVLGLITSISSASLAMLTDQPSTDEHGTSDWSPMKRPAMSQEAMDLGRRIVAHEEVSPRNYADCEVWLELNSKFVEMTGIQARPNARYASICDELVPTEAKRLYDFVIDRLENDKQGIEQTHDILKALADLKELSDIDHRVQSMNQNHHLYSPIRMITDQIIRLASLQEQGECSPPDVGKECSNQVCTQQAEQPDQNDHEESTHEDELEEEPVREPQVTSQETRDLLKDLQANVAQILLKTQLDNGDEALLKYYYDEGTRLIRDFWHEEPTDSGLLVIMSTLNAALHQLNTPATSDEPDE